MRLAYGTVQRRATLDHLIAELAGRPLDRLEPLVVAALRLGLYQLAFLDRVPAHAAVGESVALVKESSPGGAKLVNAVLRRGAREAAARVAALPDATPAEAALRHSHPEWIAALWWDALGADAARALLAADNEPAETALRVNPLRGADPVAVAAALPVAARPADGLPEGLVLDGAVRRLRLAAVGAGRLHAAVARGDDRRAAARARARRAGPRPVRRARREDDPSRRPDGRGGDRGRRRAPSRAAPTRCAARSGGWGRRRRSRSAPPTPPDRTSRAPTTACSSTRRAATSGRSPRAPTPAGARPPTSPRGSPACRGRSCAPAPTRCGPAARSSTRPARSRPPRTRTSWPRSSRAAGLPGRRPAPRGPSVGPCRGAGLPADPPASRRDRGVLHRPPPA